MRFYLKRFWSMEALEKQRWHKALHQVSDSWCGKCPYADWKAPVNDSCPQTRTSQSQCRSIALFSNDGYFSDHDRPKRHQLQDFPLTAQHNILFLPDEAVLVLHTRSKTPSGSSHPTRSLRPGPLAPELLYFRLILHCRYCLPMSTGWHSPQTLSFRNCSTMGLKSIAVIPGHKPRSLEIVHCVTFPYSYPPFNLPCYLHVSS